MAELATPVPFENTATLLAPCEYLDRDAVVAAINDFYPSSCVALVFSAFPTWDLSDAGFQLMGHPPFMVRPAGAAAAPPDVPGLEIRRVDSPTERATFGRVISEAYPMPGADTSALVRVTQHDGPLTLFNGYLDGECVATAGTWNSEGVNDVGWISAQPSTRRKGVGAALTYAATQAHPAHPAVLIASDDGVGVYERLGYIRLLRMTLWLRPPS